MKGLKMSESWMYYSGILVATGLNVDINDLKHIQDLLEAEEQGLLLKLPYKAGERVWILYKDKLIEENYVASIQIGEKNDRLCFADGYFYTIFNKDYKEVKKWVYTSKEEAEKALAEMGE